MIEFCAVLLGGVVGAGASPGVTLNRTADLDRWMYPFNGTPGTRVSASTFSSLGQEEVAGLTFDQRDGQFLLGFDTGGSVPTGLAPCAYQVTNVVVEATIEADLTFGYDPTSDDYCTYIEEVENPHFCGIVDPDPGHSGVLTARPIEMFGVGYRNGFGLVTDGAITGFEETSAHGAIAKRVRNVYPIDGMEYWSDSLGALTDDVSNNVLDAFDPAPFAIGMNASLTIGAPVPADTTLEFDVDLSGFAACYVADGLSKGRVRFLVTSLQSASTSGGGGPGTGEFASFYTKDDTIFGIPAEITLEVESACEADANGDGSVDVNDISYVLFRLGNTVDMTCGCLDGDANLDGSVDVNDISFVLFRLGQGCVRFF